MEEHPPWFRRPSEDLGFENVVDDQWRDEECEMSDSESSIHYDDYAYYESDVASETSNMNEDTVLVQALAQYLVDTFDWKDDKRTRISLLASTSSGTEAMENQPPEAPLKPSFTVPFRRNVDFVSRKAILDRIHQKCSIPGSRTALVGLGGLG
jgi:hypothetical protein